MRLYKFDIQRENSLGYDIIIMNIENDIIKFSSYRIDENGEIEGNTINEQLSGKKLSLCGNSSYTIEDVRKNNHFYDMSCFGFSVCSNYIMWADINNDTKVENSYPFLLDNNIPVKIVFPDTESNFMDCTITVPNSFNGKDFIFISNVVETKNVDDKKGDEISVCLPKITITGEQELKKDSISYIDINISQNELMLESLYDVILSCDNGYISKRKIRIFSGESETTKIYTNGLESGDKICVTASIKGYGIVAEKKFDVV